MTTALEYIQEEQPVLIEYTPWHYALIRQVFGERGAALALHACIAATDGRDRVDFDADWSMVRHTAEGSGNPFTVVHEFAHLYHICHWREVSLSAPTARLEAAAVYAECKFACGNPQLEAILAERQQAVAPDVLAILAAAPLAETADLHAVMERILAGAYGG